MDRELRWDLIWLIRLLQYRIAKLLQEYNLDFARLTVGQRRVWFIVYDNYLNILLDRWDSTSLLQFRSILWELIIVDRVILLNRQWNEA